jgi:hypothetical protein
VPVVAAFEQDSTVTLEKGRGAGTVTLKVKGKIFAMCGRDKFVAKLPRERVIGLVTSGLGKNFDANKGKPMKEWFTTAGGQDQWVALAREAYEFVKSSAA